MEPPENGSITVFGNLGLLRVPLLDPSGCLAYSYTAISVNIWGGVGAVLGRGPFWTLEALTLETYSLDTLNQNPTPLNPINPIHP